MSMDEETGNDMKKAGGYLKEKLAIGLTRWNDDELERAVIKVTSHKLKAPNEKHMARLLAATFGSYNPGKNTYENANSYIVSELEKKTHVHNWIVLLKTLVVLHKLMKEGSNEVNAEIQRNVNLFCMRHMKDVADTPEGAAQAGFIQQYTRYLEERSVAQSALRLAFRIESTEEMHSSIDAMTLEQRTVAVEALLLQMEVLSQIDFREGFVDNFATLEAFKMLADDGKRLYVILTKAIMYIIDRFLDLNAAMKKAWIALYSKYTKATAGLKILFSAMNDSRTVVFEERYPVLQEMPPSVLLDLEEMSKPPVAVTSIASITGGSRQGSPTAATVASVTPAAGSPAGARAVSTQQAEQHKQSLDLFQEFEKQAASQHQPSLIDPTPVGTKKVAAMEDIFAPVPTTAAVPTAAVVAPPPKKDVLGDLFDAPAPVVAPVRTTTTVAPVAQPPAPSAQAAPFDPFAPVAPPPQQQRQPPASVVAPAAVPVAPPVVVSHPAGGGGGGFDPFAAIDPPKAAVAAQPINFFEAPRSTTAQSTPPPQAHTTAPVYTADGRARAW